VAPQPAGRMGVAVCLRDVRLFGEVDAALRPAGMPNDLSRLIAQFARCSRWAANERFTITDTGEGCSATLTTFTPNDWVSVVSDLPIVQFPGPSEAKAAATLRFWTIRIDAVGRVLYPGISKPVTAPDYDRHTDPHSVYVCTGNPAFVGGKTRNGHIPHSSLNGAGGPGSLYHFTADLSSGSLRVRPVISRIAREYRARDPDQTEWTIAEGIADLADCRASVFARTDWGAAAVSLLFGAQT
jgi:hypothetical protein